MIIIECPHCGKEHILKPDETYEVLRHGKVVVTDCPCGKMYVVENDGDCIFSHSYE